MTLGALDHGPLGVLCERVSDATYPYVDAVLVARSGSVIFEKNFNGWDHTALHQIQSCTKSVLALLVGIGLDQGWIDDLDDHAWRYLPARAASRWVRERYPVTIRQLLAMTAGLVWNETVPYGQADNDNTAMNNSPDWVDYVLDRPLAGPRVPGSFEYQSGCSIVMGEILHAATGRTVPDLAAEFLFGPLEITQTRWSVNHTGVAHTGGGLQLTSRDLLTLGQLVLAGGSYDGRRIVSGAWCELMTSRQSSNEKSHYGLHWWLLDHPAYGLNTTCISALGYGGQALHVLPDHDAVVVTLASDFSGSGSIVPMLREHILPALAAL